MRDRFSVVKLWTEIRQCMDILQGKYPELPLQNIPTRKGQLTGFIDDYNYKKQYNTIQQEAVIESLANSNDG